jgi:hypothetical protein
MLPFGGERPVRLVGKSQKAPSKRGGGGSHSVVGAAGDGVRAIVSQTSRTIALGSPRQKHVHGALLLPTGPLCASTATGRINAAIYFFGPGSTLLALLAAAVSW